MFSKIKLRINHWIQTKIFKKKPVQARIFIKENLSGYTRKRILIKDWREVENLYTKIASWKWFVLTNRLTKEAKHAKLKSAGWENIIYE